MRKVSAYKLYFLGLLLIVCLSVFALVAYKQVHSLCSVAGSCPRLEEKSNQGEILWDILSHQFVTDAGIPR